MTVNGFIIIDIYRFGALEKDIDNKPSYYDYNFSGKIKKDWSRQHNGQALTRWSKQEIATDSERVTIEFIYEQVDSKESKR